MQFLKTLFWVILAVVIVIFGANNWIPASIKLWGGLRLDTKLPVLMGCAVLVGFIPPFLVLKTANWRLRKRVHSLEAERRLALAEHGHLCEDKTARDAAAAPAATPAATPAPALDPETGV